MNERGRGAEWLAADAKRLGVHVRNPCRASLPHSRAGREDLQRVAAKFPGRFQCMQITPRNGGMNPDSKAPIHPRWWQRFRLRFRAVFVFWVKLRRLDNGLFRDAGGQFLLSHKLYILAHAPNRPCCPGFPLTNKLYLCRVSEWVFASAPRVRLSPSSRRSSPSRPLAPRLCHLSPNQRSFRNAVPHPDAAR